MNTSIAEQQRRIHELEMRAEQHVHAEDTLPPQSQQSAQPEQPGPQRERREEVTPPPPPRVEEPRIDPKELLESAGLVMIETDRSKAIVQPAAAEAPQPVGRPRRERPKPQPQDDPLVQIETRK